MSKTLAKIVIEHLSGSNFDPCKECKHKNICSGDLLYCESMILARCNGEDIWENIKGEEQ